MAHLLEWPSPEPITFRATQPVPGLGLDVGFWLEYELGRRSVNLEEAARIGLNADELLAEALANLRARLPMEVVRDVIENQQVRVSNTGDGYDATRILLVPGYLREGEAIAAAIARPDILILYPADTFVEGKSIWTFLRERTSVNIEKYGRDGVLLEDPIRVTKSGFQVVAEA